MSGLFFGLSYQLIVAIGFIWIEGVAKEANPVVKANVMLCASGVVALVLLGFLARFPTSVTASLSRSDMLQLGLGALLILVVGESLYQLGLSVSNASTMAYTALAFPAICLALDVALRRVPFASLGARDLIGFVLLAIGFALIGTRGEA